MQRMELERYLNETLSTDKFKDFCLNGLQVEGKADIRRIALGVSFSLPLVEQAVAAGADALIVHHGIFGKDLFHLTGPLKTKIALLLKHEISLFGLHLPLDAHPELGNNSRLLAFLGAEVIEPFDVGFLARNTRNLSLEDMLRVLSENLLPRGYHSPECTFPAASVLMPKTRYGFWYYDQGPEIPETMVVISGGAAKDYRDDKFLTTGADTYICGAMGEDTAARAYETASNFINAGHYWTERCGLQALARNLEVHFDDIATTFLEIPNPV